MWRLRRSIFSLFTLLLVCSAVDLGAAQKSWQTLRGNAPLVIARGGFSGIFPDSSISAYNLSVQTGLPNMHVWCDVQLTRDGAGICFPDIRLNNASDIDMVYPDRRSTYNVNGVRTEGWFSVDFTRNELASVDLTQGIYTRAPNFDNYLMPIQTVENVVSMNPSPPGLWLNVAHDAFFSQHNLSMRSYILAVSRRVIVNYISSPEVGFLRSIASRFRTGSTRLVFQFLGPTDVEPSTIQTYSSLLNNLTLISTFASGILVPKNYIWPVGSDLYLQNYTSLVLDAHRAGLQVFASDFANDAILPYDYSYDPVSEYLSFVDNGIFSVDGVLSGFPITPSATIDCFSHIGRNDSVHENILVISNEGASGDYPGCTDSAYTNAVSDGVDILDCPVQMTNDGIPICMGSINLRDRTNVAQSDFSNLATNNPDLNIDDGIFVYNLTWSQIQTLRPAIVNPYFENYTLIRNPRANNDGNFMQLSEFLAFANSASSVSGVLISIEHAAYLAENRDLSVINAVLDALSQAGYNNQKAKRVMIRSTDSAVLSLLKSRSNYELVYHVDEVVRDISNSTILEIKTFANSVAISKRSDFPTNSAFIKGGTNVVPKLQAFNLTVYVQLFRNEFVSQPWDFLSDAYVEIHMHVQYMGINGVITDFPATAARYKRNRCLGYGELPMYMSQVHPGFLLSYMPREALPPAQAPSPVLTESDVVEPPLHYVAARTPFNPTGNVTTATETGSTPPNGQPTLISSTIIGGIASVLAAFVLCWG